QGPLSGGRVVDEGVHPGRRLLAVVHRVVVLGPNRCRGWREGQHQCHCGEAEDGAGHDGSPRGGLCLWDDTAKRGRGIGPTVSDTAQKRPPITYPTHLRCVANRAPVDYTTPMNPIV